MATLGRNARGAALALALACMSSAAGQNLLQNPGFAGNLNGWSMNFGFAYDPLDAGGGSSGSALGRKGGATGVITLYQCVPVSGGTDYEFGAYVRPVAGHVPTAGGLLANFFSDPACVVYAGGGAATSGYLADTWAEIRRRIRAPGDARAAAVGPYLTAAGIMLEGQMYFDDVYLRPAAPLKGDLDADSHDDLVFQHQQSGALTLWSMNDSVRTTEAAVAPAPAGPQARVVGADDFNADRRADLVFRSAVTGAVEFWMMDGANRLGAPQPLTGAWAPSLAWQLAATGDFDHDARPDLLWRNLQTQKLLVWRMAGTAKAGEIVPVPDQAAHANWSVAAALDYDRDGNRDLLWYNSTSGRIAVWRMDANLVRLSGNFTDPPSAGDANWKVVAGGDYGTGPGGWPSAAADIVWRNETTGRIVVWHMSPYGEPLRRVDGVFTTPDAPAEALDQRVVAPR